MALKKHYSALNHVILALASAKDKDFEGAADHLMKAADQPDLEEALQDVHESQEENTDGSDEDDSDDGDNSDLVEAAVAKVSGMSRIKRKKLLRKAVAVAGLDEDDAEEVDLTNPEDVVEAVCDSAEGDKEEVARILRELELASDDSSDKDDSSNDDDSDNDGDDDSDDDSDDGDDSDAEDEEDEDDTQEAATASLARRLRQRHKQASRNMKGA